jgi:hypothetical protein
MHEASISIPFPHRRSEANHTKTEDSFLSGPRYDTCSDVQFVRVLCIGLMHANDLPGIVHSNEDTGIDFTDAFEQTIQVFAFHDRTYNT